LKKVLFVLAVSFSLFAQPSWYGAIAPKPYELIGYGEGVNAKEAKASALEDIASRLKVKIDSNFESNVTIKNQELSSVKQAYLKVGSNMSLYGVAKLAEEETDGKWWAAYSYDDRPFARKFASKFGQKACEGKVNQLLNNSPLLGALSDALGCAPKLEILREDGVYKLVSNGGAMVMDDEAIGKSLFVASHPNISLVPSKVQVVDGETISLSIKTKVAGFVNIFDIYSDGKVSLMLSNSFQKANALLRFPDDAMKDTELSLSADSGNAMDMFVAILSSEKLELSQFEHASAKLASGSAYNYDDLLKLMQKHQATSVIIKVVSKR
jgi:Domain of unknown function (DUF4384)/LPP20 lipoprotein